MHDEERQQPDPFARQFDKFEALGRRLLELRIAELEGADPVCLDLEQAKAHVSFRRGRPVPETLDEQARGELGHFAVLPATKARLALVNFGLPLEGVGDTTG